MVMEGINGEMKGAAMSEVTETEVVKHITNSLNEMYAKGYADGLNAEPQLTIPKSIAERLDKEIMADAVTKFAMFHEGFERLWLSDELEMYCADKENYALASAYLNPLTRDLVKVVEG